MQKSDMKNIVVLKNMPSNIVEEAIVILKSAQYAKMFEMVDKNNNSSAQEIKNKGKDFVIKEAEMLISSYENGFENKKIFNNKKEDAKYKALRKYSVIMTLMFLFSLTLNFIF